MILEVAEAMTAISSSLTPTDPSCCCTVSKPMRPMNL